ncbi:MAG TPA: hypothetical protein VF067_01525 [Sphingomicrobium sp.]
MVGYRLYGLDGVDKVATAEWIEAEDDNDAIAVAKEKMDGRGWELWTGRRLVLRHGNGGLDAPPTPC